MERESTGRIFNIQRYSLHDGAGIRTLVFLKGCPLRCLWCSNPESQRATSQLGYIDPVCVGSEACGAPCAARCPEAAIALGTKGKPIIDRSACNGCGKCAEVCTHEALKVVGSEMSVAEVMAEVEKDRPFYRRSGGGITIGGGEPLAQYQFTAELLEAAADEYLHTAIETSGHTAWKNFEKVLRHTDQVHMDLKHMDPEIHKTLTGVSNDLILDNLRRTLSIREPQDVTIRIPLIPGYNDSVENLSASASFLGELGFTQIELMPYHKFGISKYPQYGMAYSLGDLEPTDEVLLQSYRDLVEGFGLVEVSD